MKISIITVCYNSAKTIEDTLKSVLNQSIDNYEYIIKDGGSTDNTLEIIEKYKPLFKGKLKLITGRDKGLYDAMNTAVSSANGDIIGLINSDDVLANSNVFKTVLEEIGENDGIYSNLVYKDGNLKNNIRKVSGKPKSYKLGWHPPHPTLYLKREAYEKYGYFSLEYHIAADYDFMLRLLKNNVKLKYVNKTFVYMRSGGVSSNGLKGYYKNFKESYKVLRRNNIKFPLTVSIIRTIKTLKQIIIK